MHHPEKKKKKRKKFFLTRCNRKPTETQQFEKDDVSLGELIGYHS